MLTISKSELYFTEAKENIENKRYDKAIDLLSKVLDIEPDNIDALFSLAYSLGMNGDYEEAIKKYHDYIELEPDNYVALNNLGANYENINNFIEALKYYNLSIDKNQRYALSRRNRGSLLNNNGELDKAIIDLKISLEIEPDDAQGLNSLGVAYLRKKEYKMAIDYFDKALHLMPESALFIANKKLAMKALG